MIIAPIRYFLIGVLLVLNLAILVLSVTVFGISDSHNTYRPIYVYLIFLGAFSCVFLIPIALIDLFRRGALPSRVHFELSWLVLFWIMHLAGASALTASSKCTATESCESTHQTLLVFSWLAVSVLLVHLAALLTIAVVHMDNLPEVWSLGVRDAPWFQSPKDKQQGQLQPQPQSAVLPTPVSAAGPPPPTAARRQSQQPRPHRQNSQQENGPWHGRSRSHTSRSWRERFSSQSFPGQNPDNIVAAEGGQPRDVNAVVDAARAFYPFLGQGDAPRMENVREEETAEPMPVSFRLERIQQPQAQPRSQQAVASDASTQPAARPPHRSGSMDNAGARTAGPRPPPSHSRRRSHPSQPVQALPPPPASTQPHRRTRSRSQAQASAEAGPSGSGSRVDAPASVPVAGPSSRRPQLYPLEIPQASSSSNHPAPPPSRPPRATQPYPPTDSLLFSAPAPAASTSNNLSIPNRPPRTTTQQPQRSPRALPNISAFYSTQVQSALDDGSSSPEGADGRSVRTYASTPKPKPLSAAQAYAAAAQSRYDAEHGQGQQGPPVSWRERG